MKVEIINKALKNKNSKNVITNVVNTLVIKGGAIIIGLLTTPAYLRYFNENAVLGVWFTLLSVLTWILSFDLGIGNGLRNRLVKSFVNNDVINAKKYISSSYIFLVFISTFIGIVVYIISMYIDWNNLFNISTKIIGKYEFSTAIGIIVLSILFQFILRLITSILYAMQKSFIPNLLILITNVILLVYIVSCNYFDFNNNIVNLALTYLFAVNIPLLVTTFIVFGIKLKELKPDIRFFDKKIAIDTLKVGSAFLFIQILAMIVNNTNVVLISTLFSAEEVVEYNIYFKIFSMVTTFFGLLTVPIWSAVTKAIAERDYLWVKKTTRTLQLVAIVFSLGQFLIFPFLQYGFDVWLGDKTFQISYENMVFFAIEQVFMIWASLNAAIANGLNELKLQTLFMSIGVLIIFIVSLVLAEYFHNYISVIIAHCLALLPYCLVQSIWLEKYFSKELKKVKVYD